MAILSIQSRVTSGYVGNAAATPVLQRLGHDVWPIDTVVYSNHPAHGAHTGGARPAREVTALIDGLADRKLLGRCEAVLSGYLGAAASGPAVLDATARIRAANPTALWCCDPVMGDDGVFYVADGIAEFFRDAALPAADIVTPNAFEAAYLCGREIESTGDAVRAARLLRERGPRVVVVTGLQRGASIGAVAATADGVWHAETPMLQTAAYGAGDVFSALFLGHYLRANDAPDALGLAISGVHAVLRATAEAAADDLHLIDALDVLRDPPPRHTLEKLE